MVWFEEDQNQMTVPHLFRCPISLDIFTDPVTLSTGQTYDRSSIEKWLADGNLTCPVTMQKLQDLSMVPNHTLRHLINQWLLVGTQLSPNPMTTTDAEASLASLKAKLGAPDQTTLAVRLQTLKKIRALSEDSDSSRACLIEHGFYSLLVEFLFGNTLIGAELSPENALLVEEALQCILNLSLCTRLGCLNTLKEEPNLTSLSNLFRWGGIKIKTSLCYLIEEISSSSETRELASVLGQTRPILQGLLSLLKQPSVHPTASDAAIRAISGLCGLDLNRESFVREGAIHGLIMYLSNSDRSSVSRALSSLEALLGLESGKKALLSNLNAAQMLVRMVFRRSDPKGSESAVGCLLIISCDSLRFREEIIRAGVVTQLLLLLQSQCSERAKTQSRILLKLLRSMWVEDPRTSNFEYGLFDS
ncbi:U-box domain-containing protein 26-like [Aristolochia californica]|uniref:U-box domain-containing protein 26-like n=1 Tax=Aristolochia californica TaxID=171875 RepID=UPI0035DCC975